MTEEINKSESRIFGIFSIIIPIVNILAVYCLQSFSGKDSYINLISAGVYIVCFDFIYTFFLRKSDLNIFDIKRNIILTVCLSAAYSLFYIDNEILTSVLVLLIVVAAGLCYNRAAGLIILSGMICYSFIFASSIVIVRPTAFIVALFSVIVLGYLKEIASMIQAVVCLLAFYLILNIVLNGFAIEPVINIENISICLFYITIIVGAFLIKTNYISDSVYTDNTSNKKSSDADESKTIIVKEEYADENTEPEKIIEIKEVIKKEEKIIYKIPDFCADDFSYICKLKKDSPKLYKHCIQIAALSTDAASLIGADCELTNILAMYHEASRILGENYETILEEKYNLPGYLTRLIGLIKQKDSSYPINRETGIIILSEDIIATINYLVSKNETVSMDRVVTNAIKVRKEKGVLRQAGFSNEEIQLLKLFYVDAGGNYDTSN